MNTWKTKPEDKIISTQETTIEIARWADDNKAEDIQILDVQGIANFTDYFIFCTEMTRTHSRKIGQTIEINLKQSGNPPTSAVGYSDTDWIVIDCGTIVVHIFSGEAREYYSLERLWGDAIEVEWAEQSSAVSGEK